MYIYICVCGSRLQSVGAESVECHLRHRFIGRLLIENLLHLREEGPRLLH